MRGHPLSAIFSSYPTCPSLEIKKSQFFIPLPFVVSFLLTNMQPITVTGSADWFIFFMIYQQYCFIASPLSIL